MEHDGCKGCVYERKSVKNKHCRGCKQNATDKYKRMTNADRIRQMNNMELVNLLIVRIYEGEGHFYKTTVDGGVYDMYEMAEKDMIEWLESEVD